MRTRLRLLLTTLAVLCIVKVAQVAVAYLQEQFRPASVVLEITGPRKILSSSAPAILKKEITYLPGVMRLTEQRTTPSMQRWGIQYNKRRLTAGHLVNAVPRLVRQQGYADNLQMRLVVYIDAPSCVETFMMCPACFSAIPKALLAVKGVRQVSLNSYGKKAYIEFAPDAETSLSEIEKALSSDPHNFSVSFTDPAEANLHAFLKSNLKEPSCDH